MHYLVAQDVSFGREGQGTECEVVPERTLVREDRQALSNAVIFFQMRHLLN